MCIFSLMYFRFTFGEAASSALSSGFIIREQSSVSESGSVSGACVRTRSTVIPAALAAFSLLFKIIFIISFPLWIIEWIFSFSPINSSRYEIRGRFFICGELTQEAQMLYYVVTEHHHLFVLPQERFVAALCQRIPLEQEAGFGLANKFVMKHINRGREKRCKHNHA